MAQIIQILDPRAEPKTVRKRLAPRPDDLKGKVVGLLTNEWWSFGVAEKRFEEILRDRYGVTEFVRGKKHGAAPPEMMEEFVSRCDVVINGMGN
ncbi:MAG: hypothetical protein HYX92_22550 [Chloroflexi bacterium]|nr:hypothetical protein [Chloroflexota bacterium]